MKNKDLIKALLDFPLDSEVHVAGFDGATGERNWDGGVETLRTDGQNNIYVEFNELFLDNYEEQTATDNVGDRRFNVEAKELRRGDVFDSEPIFDYFDREKIEYDQADRYYAEANLETVHDVIDIGAGYVQVVTNSGECYGIPADFIVEVMK